jgi:hypothetical protein
MFIRVFGLLGLMLASGYFVNGLTFLVDFIRGLGREEFGTTLFRFTITSLDLLSALALVVAAVGLFLAQRWARKMWLMTMSILAALHLTIMLLYQLGNGIDTVHLVWTWMVLLITALSWWYFNKHSTIAVPQPQIDRVTGI